MTPPRRLVVRGTVAAVLVLGLAAVLVAAVTGLRARDALLRAEQSAAALAEAVSDGRTAEASRLLPRLREDTGRARSLLDGPTWRLAERLPGVGDSVRVLRGLSRLADEATRAELTLLVEAAAALDPTTLRSADGRVDVERLSAAAGPLAEASRLVAARQRQLEALPRARFPEALVHAQAELGRRLADAPRLADAAAVAAVAPGMLGADGPRRYWVAIQNNAELRSTGGNAGAYAVVVADRGRLRLERTGDSRDYRRLAEPPVDLGPAYVQLHGLNSLVDVRNANVTPHFPTAAAVWAAQWAVISGERVDGVLALDPVALAAVLRVLGPVTLDRGQVVRADDVVDVTLRRAYEEEVDNGRRKDANQALFRAVFDQAVVAPRSALRPLGRALGSAAGGRHLQLASSRPAEQRVLERFAVAGVLPDGGPALGVFLDNATGGKLDYYLDRDLTVETTCAGASATTVVTVRLTNRAPTSGLPEYVLIRADLPPGRTAPPGQNATRVTLYAPEGSRLVGADLDGRPLSPTLGFERRHPAASAVVTLDAGRTVTLTFRLTGPAVAPRLVDQAFLRPMPARLDAAGC